MKIRKSKGGGLIAKGRAIKEDIRDDKGILLLRKGMEVTAIEDRLARLAALDIQTEKKVEKREKIKIEIEETPFDTIAQIQVELDGLYRNVESNDEIEPRVDLICKSIQKVCHEDSDAALGSIMLDDFRRYSVKHTLHASLVCEIISKHLGWNDEDRQKLIAAALTMNISITDMQDRLYSQKEQLSVIQKQDVKMHPQRSVMLLKRRGVLSNIWLNAVMQHHESPDGSGYPRGLKSDDIHINARLLSLSDIYCARVTGRKHRSGLRPNQAMREIFLSGEKSAEEDLALIFIKVLGIYPPGTFVRLANREIAIVSHRGDQANAPMVFGLVKPDGSRIFNPTVRDCRSPEFAVQSVILPSQAKVDINRFQIWGYGVHYRPKLRGKERVKPLRKCRRIAVHVPAKILDIIGMKTYDAMIIDLSESGCLIKTTLKSGRDLKINTSYYISFKAVTRLMENLHCIPRMNRIETDGRSIGLEFVLENDKEADDLKYIIDKLTGTIVD